MPERIPPALPPGDDALEAWLADKAGAGACPHPDLLNALSAGVLPPEGEAPLRAHTVLCPLCQALMAAEIPAPALDDAARARIAARIRAGAERAPAMLPAGRRGWRRPLVWLPAAAALVLAAGLAVRYRSPQRPPAATAAVTAPYPAIAAIAALEPPDSGPALVARGAPARRGGGPTVTDLLPAFQAYNRDDYAQAAAAFTQLAARFPRAATPPLYLGVSQLELGQNAAAQRSLQQALPLTDAAQHDAAAWYLALASVRLHQPQAALPLLRGLCAQPGRAYATQACQLAAQLPSH